MTTMPGTRLETIRHPILINRKGNADSLLNSGKLDLPPTRVGTLAVIPIAIREESNKGIHPMTINASTKTTLTQWFPTTPIIWFPTIPSKPTPTQDNLPLCSPCHMVLLLSMPPFRNHFLLLLPPAHLLDPLLSISPLLLASLIPVLLTIETVIVRVLVTETAHQRVTDERSDLNEKSDLVGNRLVSALAMAELPPLLRPKGHHIVDSAVAKFLI